MIIIWEPDTQVGTLTHNPCSGILQAVFCNLLFVVQTGTFGAKAVTKKGEYHAI
jgi:hypothetical protein